MRARLVPSCCVLSCCTLLTLTAAGDTAAQTPRWTTREVLRLGSVDGPAALSNVFDAEFAPDGRILVSQTQAGIAEFGPDGRYRRTVGRLGKGPGEFTFVGRLGWEGDTLSVTDLARMNLFSADLEFVETLAVTLDDPPPGFNMGPAAFMAGNTVLFVAYPGSATDRPPPLILGDRDGRTVARLGHTKDLSIRYRVALPSGRPMTYFEPWRSTSLASPEPDGRSILILNRRVPDGAATHAFELIRIGLTGDTLLGRRIEYAPREIGDDLADRHYREAAEALGSRHGLTVAAAERLIREAVPLPRFVPAVSGMIPASDGTTWLRREDMRAETVEWQVLDRDFSEIARLTLPADLDVFRVSGDRILGRVLGELDVPFVVVHEIRRDGN